MTVLYVDMEHDAVVHDPALGPAHRAKRETARQRVAAAAVEPCAVLRFGAVSLPRIGQAAPRAIVVSGCNTAWDRYDFTEFNGLLAVIRAAPVPILGICAGHQLIGYAHGAPWGPLGPLREGEADPDPRFAPGQRKQRGFLPVLTDPDSPLFEGVGAEACVFQSHYWHLLDVPMGFTTRARSLWSPIQAIERGDRPVFGVQFHAERYDAAHPAGARILRNFFNRVAT